MKNIYFNSHEEKYKNPFGAVSQGTDVLIQIEVEDYDCEVHLVVDNESNIERYNMNKKGSTYSFILDTSNYKTTIYYYFEIKCGDEILYYANNCELWGGEGSIYNDIPKNLYQITVYNRKYFAPQWFLKSTIYQIFVDRFYNPDILLEDLNQDIQSVYGGNLKGIIEKLDYIKSLGASAIYLTPIFESDEYHRYHTKNYERIEKSIGDEEIFSELVSEMKKRNMHLILDCVFNHCSWDSKYFNKFDSYDTVGAYQSKNSKYYDWFIFNEYPDDYYTYLDVDELPKFNGNSEGLLDYLLRKNDSIIKRWMDYGIGGWRMDAANYMEDVYLENIYNTIKSYNSNAVVIGEAWNDASNYNYYDFGEYRRFFAGSEFDSMIHYPLHGMIIEFINGNYTADIFKSRYYSLMENYPFEYLYSTANFISNHDVGRALTALNGNIDYLKNAFCLLFSLPGVPIIYYGDEVGLDGGWEPDCRKAFPWSNMNHEILDTVKTLSFMRNNHEAFIKGDIEFIDFDELLIFKRNYDNENLIVVLNNTDKDILFEYSYDLIDIYDDSDDLCIKSHSFKIFKIV